jgi:endonuclease/exonuclease/phosphatase (EEP) superfamily protein YafD
MHPADTALVSPPAPRRFARSLTAAAVLVLCGSAAGFLGGWYWLLDLTTHFRWYWFLLSAGGLTAAAVLRRPVAAAVLAAAVLVNVRDLLPYWLPPPAVVAAIDHRPVRVLSLNVHRANRETTAAIDHIRARRPDVVAVLEVDDHWAEALTGLADVLPHRMIVPRADNFGIAVLSRWPLVDPQVAAFTATGYPSIVTTVRHEQGDFRLIATHPFPPFDGPATAQLLDHLGGVADAATATTLPCIVAGDLNAAPWSRAFRRLVTDGGLRDTALGRGVRGTYHAGLPAPRIPIDHVLVPPGTVVVRRAVGPGVGSDHFPVEADVILP